MLNRCPKDTEDLWKVHKFIHFHHVIDDPCLQSSEGGFQSWAEAREMTGARISRYFLNISPKPKQIQQLLDRTVATLMVPHQKAVIWLKCRGCNSVLSSPIRRHLDFYFFNHCETATQPLCGLVWSDFFFEGQINLTPPPPPCNNPVILPYPRSVSYQPDNPVYIGVCQV